MACINARIDVSEPVLEAHLRAPSPSGGPISSAELNLSSSQRSTSQHDPQQHQKVESPLLAEGARVAQSCRGRLGRVKVTLPVLTF